MSQNLSDFITIIKQDGVAYSAHFVCEVEFPDEVNPANDNDSSEKLLMLCENVTMPGIEMMTAPYKTYGEAREVPYDRQYTPIQMSFICDQRLGPKQLFERWVDKIHPGFTRLYNYYEDYIAKTFKIHTLDHNSNKWHTIELYGAYPKIVQSSPLDYNSRDIVRVQTVISYWYFESKYSESKLSSSGSISEPSLKGNMFFDYSSSASSDIDKFISDYEANQAKASSST